MSKPTITATTPKTMKATVGQVVELGVEVAGTRKPVSVHADGADRPLRLFDGKDGDLRAFLAAPAGTTRVTASVEGATPVEFTITTTQAAGETAADTEKE